MLIFWRSVARQTWIINTIIVKIHVICFSASGVSVVAVTTGQCSSVLLWLD